MTTFPDRLDVVAVLRARPERSGEVRAALRSLIEPTRAESGCLRYDLGQPQDDPSTFILTESWRSRADLEAHFAKPYFRALLAQQDAMLVEPPSIRFIAPLG